MPLLSREHRLTTEWAEECVRMMRIHISSVATLRSSCNVRTYSTTATQPDTPHCGCTTPAFSCRPADRDNGNHPLPSVLLLDRHGAHTLVGHGRHTNIQPRRSHNLHRHLPGAGGNRRGGDLPQSHPPPLSPTHRRPAYTMWKDPLPPQRLQLTRRRAPTFQGGPTRQHRGSDSDRLIHNRCEHRPRCRCVLPARGAVHKKEAQLRKRRWPGAGMTRRGDSHWFTKVAPHVMPGGSRAEPCAEEQRHNAMTAPWPQHVALLRAVRCMRRSRTGVHCP